ncbi:hypothetical protein BDV29DRAFT_63211 [Aspergillus leporis]|uniref:Uncharacterized protein n=1 Tax=Aspergillus leporis TaxID=41062 RepID=A0A5N5WLW6_9EURO|nr:hypothetical protein BDV29DRAFT_63211 [Aspergillus leporis]
MNGNCLSTWPSTLAMLSRTFTTSPIEMCWRIQLCFFVLHPTMVDFFFLFYLLFLYSRKSTIFGIFSIVPLLLVACTAFFCLGSLFIFKEHKESQ